MPLQAAAAYKPKSRAMPPPSRLDLDALPDSALLTEVECAAIIRRSTSTLGNWRFHRPDHPLKWKKIDGHILYSVRAIRRYLVVSGGTDVDDARRKTKTGNRGAPAVIAVADRAEEGANNIGSNNTGEAMRLRARIDELQYEKRLIEIENVGLRSEIDDIKAACKPKLVGKGDKRSCSFCGEGQDKVSMLLVVYNVAICEECVDLCVKTIAEQKDAIAKKAAPPPADDGLGVPDFLRRQEDKQQ